MGKLILCNGTRTTRPYVFQTTGIHIYSIEELCWYLNHYVYFIDENMFDDALIDFIEKELNLAERADKLRQLKAMGADLKTIVTVVLCSSDYYTENEIKALLKILDRIIGMPRIMRDFVKANIYLKNRQFKEAAEEYKKILDSKDALDLTPEEYGDIYHNLGVATIHLKGVADAAEFFHQAYLRNDRAESFQQYLYAVCLNEDKDKFKEKADRYRVSEEETEKIINDLKLAGEEADKTSNMIVIRQMRQLKEEGKMNELYRLADVIIDEWKTSLRKISYQTEKVSS